MNQLAIHGAPPAFPAGPPTWPVPDAAVDEIVRAALSDGSWGRYEAFYRRSLEEKLCELHGVDFALTCCSGTFAVQWALAALPVRPGDEVILAAYDFPGNFRAIEALGALPVLVDIDPSTYCLDAECFAQALGPKTRAVIVSHLHGGRADMQRVVALARTAGVGVVEDACQAPGAQVQGRVAGGWGDVGVLSFGGSKLLTAGRGGAILTRHASICQRAKIYNERGNEAFPLSELQAAVLLPQLEKLASRNRQRAASAQLLRQLCASAQRLQIQNVVTDDQHELPAYYKLALRDASSTAARSGRDDFIAAALAEGISVGPGFRGFTRRGSARCRSVGTLTHSTNASTSTVLLHHPVLLESEPYIRSLADTLVRICRLLG